jgi:hypothetical protein
VPATETKSTMVLMGLASWTMVVSLLAGQNGAPAANPNAAATSSAAQLDPQGLPVNVDRIQRALSRPPAIRLESERTVFRIEIFGRKPTIEDILGRDYLKGPAPAGAMTHREFLNLVTPKDVQGYAAFDNKQAAMVALTSVTAQVLQWAVQKAIGKYKDAKSEREREAARKEVEEALAELRRARRAAGLPDK